MKKLLTLAYYLLILIPVFLLMVNVYTIQLNSSKVTSPLAQKKPSTRLVTPVITKAVLATESAQIKLAKKKYSIALYGDSMIDTMGEKVEHLDKALKETYPGTSFELYNYGIGAQNVEKGLARFYEPFDYQTRKYLPVSELRPDILILGTFAYNPLTPHDKNKHYLRLSELVKKAKEVSNKVYILSEIAPRKSRFGVGKQGVNWQEADAYQHVLKIVDQLQNAPVVANTLSVPLINVTKVSLIDGPFGDPYYVSPDDGIHPSFAGHVLTAKMIVKTIEFK